MNLPLSTDFTVSHRFWVVVFSFSLLSMHILISFFIYSVICWIFRSMLLSLLMLEFLIVFLLWLTSNLTALWSEKMLGMISIFFFFNLPTLDLWPRMWSILEKFPYALEKKVKFIVLEWNVLWLSVRSNWSIVSFKVCVSLLIFCLVDLSIGVSGILKSPTIIVLLLMSYSYLLALALHIVVLLCWVHIYL